MEEKTEVVMEKISKEDLDVLEQSKLKKLLTKTELDKALAQNELAELSYKYVILQIYRKYNLLDSDSFNESTGEIIQKPL